MSRGRKDIFRKELTPHFVAAALYKKPKGDLAKMLQISEAVRSEILLPASKRLDDIEIDRKEVGDGRMADVKTFSIKTDHECEDLVERKLKDFFPEAMFVGEEKFGLAPLKEKKAILAEMKKTAKDIFIVDALDGTRDFRMGGDGHSVIIVRVRKGEVISSLVHRVTSHADHEGFGQVITFEKGDGVRINGKAVRKLSDRSFPVNAKELRGYACFGFLQGHFSANNDASGLKLSFDSFSDVWTCATMYGDLLEGRHHFMLIDPPADLFDYPSGIALIQAAGGVARFMDGTDATIEELIKRQAYGKDGEAKVNDALVLAVSEEAFSAVQKQIWAQAHAKKQQTPKI